MSGIFGVVSKKNCIDYLFYGVDYHSHFGTEYGGIAVSGDSFKRQIHNISQSQFKSKFYNDYQHLKGNKGIGVISALNEQPMYLNSKFGPFCLVTNGFIENADALAAELMQQGVSFAEVGDKGVNETELVAKLICQGKDIIDGIEKMVDRIIGSCSLLLLNKDGVYAARDRFGYTPLVLGRSKDAFAVTSETCAFTNNGFEITKYMEPGEIVLLSENRSEQKKAEGLRARSALFCGFTQVFLPQIMRVLTLN